MLLTFIIQEKFKLFIQERREETKRKKQKKKKNKEEQMTQSYNNVWIT